MSTDMLIAQFESDAATCSVCPFNDGQCQEHGCNVPDEESQCLELSLSYHAYNI